LRAFRVTTSTPTPKEFLKILEQANVIEKGGARLEVHQQVKITARMGPSPGDRAEHGNPMSPALPGDAEDLRAASAQSLHGQHVIGHPSSVPSKNGIVRYVCGRQVRRYDRYRNTGMHPLSSSARPGAAVHGGRQERD
jgi:hypothetical protein